MKGNSTKRINKSLLKTIEGEEIIVTEQTPVPCFRCGICCTRYQPALTLEDIDRIASALGVSRSKCLSRYARKVPIKEGYVLKRISTGCIFLEWDVDGKARCTIHPSRPKACREWIASLSKPECQEGLARVKSKGPLMLLNELFPSHEEQQQLCQSLNRDVS